MMTILFAPDKFKGSLNALQVCQAMEEGLRQGGIDFHALSIPLADGGEGTGEILTHYSNGQRVTCSVLDPLFRPVKATYGISGDGTTAFLEMASASGFLLLQPEERNALYTTTYGTGHLIRHAVDQGVKNIVLGIGGSATNDGGMGMAEALGVVFYDARGERLLPVGKNLIHIDRIDTTNLEPAVKEVLFTALCDVSNPLYGPEGASYVFGPQKGADAEALKTLDDGLRNFAAVVQRQFGVDINFAGAGAGGGIGAGAKVFFDIRFQSGADFVMDFVKLDEKVAQSNMVFTGEGRVDHQTLYGKVVKRVADLAVKYEKPLFVVAGTADLTPEELHRLGAVKVVALVNAKTDKNEAMARAFSLIGQRIKEDIIPLFL
ncbi:glycerate kinase [Chryseolinea lacunae]|uniref:Glycerate kinase n=1 Tax=Chryseolinea lacunae TaxID=2801331 RepID=A0ABS1KWS6_9BACT|nr:glycerate kinase [Chryseolinea lacunae]MBL0742761.1 glycerate kinase [Chryseolinea lacunae]